MKLHTNVHSVFLRLKEIFVEVSNTQNTLSNLKYFKTQLETLLASKFN